MGAGSYPKRLIEVDLPIKRISAHARREKSIRHGHICTLHIWWARRPLASCRAVLCAALWPDPADALCPQAFRDAAAKEMKAFAKAVVSNKDVAEITADDWPKWLALSKPENKLDPKDKAHQNTLRYLLLDFIAAFAAWEASTEPHFLQTARALTQAAHEALGGAPGTRPLVVDPFAGGGSIPLEALRVGADAFASDLNPVAVLLNKVVLEYIPKYACLPAGRANAPPPEPGKSFVYVLRCKDGSFYKGQTDDVPRRLKQHEAGEVEWTTPRLPVELVHVEAFNSREEAVEREKYLKSGSGRQWLEEKLKPRTLADEVRKWGQWIKEQAEKELAEFYPKDPDGATPMAYLWARTINCEGPGCGAEVPLIRSPWLAKRPGHSVALRVIPRPRAKRVDFEIVEDAKASEVGQGTVSRGAGTCPVCGYTTPVASVRRQLKNRRGGAADARLLCVITSRSATSGRFYRLPQDRDVQAVQKAAMELGRRVRKHTEALSLVPDESIDLRGIRHTWAMIYGIEKWGDVFSPRQALALSTLARIAKHVAERFSSEYENGLATAVVTCLSLAVSRQADYTSSLCSWHLTRETLGHTFTRQALPLVWDFAETLPFSGSTGDFAGALEWIARVCEANSCLTNPGQSECASATSHPLPDDMAQCLFTDPPYYDAVAYAYLSDFFYVWLKRMLQERHPGILRYAGVPKDEEIVVDRPHELSTSKKDNAFFERELTKAFTEGRRLLRPSGVAGIVFASKTTASWEAIIKAIIDAGWTITASWPIDTEMEARVAAQGQARLASSIHLVCRPRENPDGSLQTDEVGEWREVLVELPRRIHDWMPRLAAEGVVGADAIFACLGPALEIFSRYSRVEKASGESVTLRDYLEHVWAAVAKEALDTIFEGADTRGFDQDARFTAIWFWVMKDAANGNGNGRAVPADASDGGTDLTGGETTEETGNGQPAVTQRPLGYAMEFDAARKLAQGLGVDLAELSKPGGILSIQGNVATLLSICRREDRLVGRQLALFGRGPAGSTSRGRAQARNARLKAVNARQEVLFDPEPDMPRDPSRPFLPGLEPPRDERTLMERLLDNGSTMLDRLHQTMILFGRGQTAILRPFLTETAMGQSDPFWTLAQALSALYPANSDEKRWVDGVLARKKGLGF